MIPEDQILSKYIGAVKNIVEEKNDSAWMRGYASALQGVLELDDDAWIGLIKG